MIKSKSQEAYCYGRRDEDEKRNHRTGIEIQQVIAKLAKFLSDLEANQERMLAFHGLWNEKRILTHFRRTLISHRLYGVGKSYAMRGFKLRMYS